MPSAARTLSIAHVDAERGFSGGEVQVFLLMEGLRARGHRSVLVAPGGSAAERVARERGFETSALPLASDLDLGSAARLRRLLERGRIDLVHLHTGRAAWLGALAARWAGVPAVATRRMDRPVRPAWRARFVYGRTCRPVAISAAVARSLEAAGVPRERIAIVPSAFDPARVEPRRARAAVRAELGAGDGDVAVLFLGALVRRKGVDVLLAAAAEASPRASALRLWIAGDGEERAALESVARELGLAARSRFLGARDDVGDLLGAADMLVLPSRAEALGVAALEGMAAGLPVVASRVGGLCESIEDGVTGRLVAPDDARALGDALAELASDPAARARLGCAARERARERYAPDAMVDAYERIYSEVLAPAAAAHR